MLVWLALGLLVLQQGGVAHVHEDATAGVYNEAHVLQTLAGGGVGTLPLAPETVALVTAVPSPAGAARARPPSPPLRHTAPRAPPSA